MEPFAPKKPNYLCNPYHRFLDRAIWCSIITYMSARIHSPLAVICLATALVAAGCGSSRPAGGSTSSYKAKNSGPPSVNQGSEEKKGKGGRVADTARAATLKRKGSWAIDSDKVREVAPMVRKAARDNDIPEDLIYGIIWVESRFNPEAVSPVGARGLMQLMPKTADYLAECIDWKGRHRAFDPEFNIAAGSYYIARLIKQFDGDVDLALAAYNAGPTKIRRWMNSDGLPTVSIEYHTMVQTARSFFGGTASSSTGSRPADRDNYVPSNDDLDRLGLAILIAGLSDKEFGLERTDDANPFD